MRLINTRPASKTLFQAPIMRTLILSNSSGISAAAILRYKCYRWRVIQLHSRPVVNSRNGLQRANTKVPSWGQYRRLAVKCYAWSPSHDQCGMLRPFGTSSAD